eukprot:s386_g46.t1
MQLQPGEVFPVSEVVKTGEDQTYLKLADGRGWAFTHSSRDGRQLCERLSPEEARAKMQDMPRPGEMYAGVMERMMRDRPGEEGKGRADLNGGVRTVWLQGRGRERKGKEGKGTERKGKNGQEGKGRERKGKEGKGRERKGKEREGKGKEGKGRERNGKGRERKGKEGKGTGREGKGREKRKGKEREWVEMGREKEPLGLSELGCADGCGRCGCKG